MAKILCLETSTTNCSVALSFNGNVVGYKEDKTKGYSHAEKLHAFITDVLKDCNTEKEDLDAIAISKGPGSYTGLRIGVSAAKGLCFALDIPLLSLPTLNVLAEGITKKNTIVTLLDARRMEVYSAVFDQEHVQIRKTEAEVLEANSFNSYLENGPVIFIGDGVNKFKEICKHPNAIFYDELPSSKDMAALAEKKFSLKDFENVAYFEPYYLKDFIAG